MMPMKNLIKLAFMFLSVQTFSQKVEVPYINGEWWKICNTRPDISPYEYTHHNNSVCDFTIYQDESDLWHLVACVRLNTYPGSNRFFYEWTSNALRDTSEKLSGRFYSTLWNERGVFWSTGLKDKQDAFGRKICETPYNAVGKLQAPHCIYTEGKYFMFHNNDGAYCYKSKDGIGWEYLKTEKGDYKFFNMGRDVMVFDDRSANDQWIAYYTDSEFDPQCVSARISKELRGPWSEKKFKCVYDGFSHTPKAIYPHEFAESPFVLKRNDHYYLFAQMQVFVSKNPLDFTEKLTSLESGDWETRCWAPEIIRDDQGNYHIAAYRVDGIWMAELGWKKITD
jgi:hypothetical protein